MNDFKVGDVVELKSGGPDMTITSIEGDKANCTWFVEGKPHYGQFPIIALQKV